MPGKLFCSHHSIKCLWNLPTVHQLLNVSGIIMISPPQSFLSFPGDFFQAIPISTGTLVADPPGMLITRVMVLLLCNVTYFKQWNSHIRDPHPSMSKTFQSLLSKPLDETQNRYRCLFHSFLLVENGDFPKVKVTWRKFLTAVLEAHISEHFNLVENALSEASFSFQQGIFTQP